jgi:hypothetical protein
MYMSPIYPWAQSAAHPCHILLWLSGIEKLISPPKGDGTFKKLEYNGRESSANGVIVYPPNVGGGGADPGVPLKTMPAEAKETLKKRTNKVKKTFFIVYSIVL